MPLLVKVLSLIAAGGGAPANQSLYIPDAQSRLVNASSCVARDSGWLAAQVDATRLNFASAR